MADAKKLVEFTRERLGRIDILVANAGIWNEADAPIEKFTEREWDEMMRVNREECLLRDSLLGAANDRAARRRIIAISSTAGQRGESFHSHYGASKGGIISFVKGPLDGTRALRYPRQLCGARLGGYGYVRIGSAQ